MVLLAMMPFSRVRGGKGSVVVVVVVCGCMLAGWRVGGGVR